MRERIERLRKILKKKALEGMIITSRSNTLYISDFGGSSSVILITQSDAYFATDFRYIEHAGKICGKEYTVEMFSVSADEYLEKKIKFLCISKIGFEDKDVSQNRYASWEEKITGREFTGIQTEVDELRACKDKPEIELIRKAVEIADNAFSHILEYIKPGIREYEIAAEIEYFMRKNGATTQAFETIVASGSRSSLPHGQATEKKIEPGDPVTLDFGALYKGYCSDMTRTVFAGNPEKEMKKIYRTVQKAQQEAQDYVKAGRTGIEIDAVSRDIIYGAGYEGCYGHGLGHGVGILVHEAPTLSTKSKSIMKIGMAVTVEPGIYIKNYGGVRIENLVIVTDEKPDVLTKSNRDMIIL